MLANYDVADLTSITTDFPGPGLTLRSAAGTVVDPFATATGPVRHRTAADLVTLIHDRMLPAEFADPETSIAENNGELLIMARKSTQLRAGHFLAELRHTCKLQVAVKALLVPMADVPAATLFDAEALAKLLGAPGMAAALAAPRILCTNGQRTHTRSGQLFSYIRNYDLAGAVYEPDVSTGLDGCVMEVLPIISGDGASVTTTLRFTYSTRIGKMETRAIVLAPPVNAVEGKQAADVKLGDRTAAEVVLPIDAPAVNIQAISAELRIPHGKWVLAGVMNNPDKDAQEKRLLLLVSAEAISLIPAPPPLPPLPAVKFQPPQGNGAGVAPDPAAAKPSVGAGGAGAGAGTRGAAEGEKDSKKSKDEF